DAAHAGRARELRGRRRPRRHAHAGTRSAPCGHAPRAVSQAGRQAPGASMRAMRSGRRMACAAIQRASVVRIFAEAPYLRSLAALVALCALLEALLDYTLSAAAVARLGRGEALVGDLVPALRRAASHCTGQLVDALLD